MDQRASRSNSPHTKASSGAGDGLSSLDVDVLIGIFALLNVRDIVALRQTCSYICKLSHLRSVWYNALAAHVLAPNIPIPLSCKITQPVEELTAKEIEYITRRAIGFQTNWESPRPRRKEQFILNSAASKVLSVHFLLGYDHRYLVSSGYGPKGQYYSVQLWDLACGTPFCAGENRVVGTAISLAVNGVASHRGAIALSLQRWTDSIIQILQIRATCEESPGSPKSSLCVAAELPFYGRILCLYGEYMVLELPHKSIILYDWTASKNLFTLQPSEEVDSHCLKAYVHHDLIFVFREGVLEFYRIPTSIPDSPKDLKCIIVHKWPWKVNSLAVAQRVSRAHCRSTYKPLSVLVRFESWFPWPVNMIHHYVLASDLSPINVHKYPEVPYILPPIMNETLSSSVRFFGRSEMAISPYGTALWLDSEGGEDTSEIDSPMYGYTPSSAGSGSSYSDVGERIAGKRIGLKLEHPDVVTAARSKRTNVSNASDLAQTRSLPSLFASRSTEGWNAITLDEEAGRVAVGGLDGLVEIWDYN